MLNFLAIASHSDSHCDSHRTLTFHFFSASCAAVAPRPRKEGYIGRLTKLHRSAYRGVGPLETPS